MTKFLIFVLIGATMLGTTAPTLSLSLPSSTTNTPIGKRAPLKLSDGRVVAYYSLESNHPFIHLASAGREVSDFHDLEKKLNLSGYATIAIEAPGIGASNTGLDQLTLDNFAEDVLSMMDNLDIEIEKAAVLGPEFGTRVAHALATFATKGTTAVILARQQAGTMKCRGKQTRL